VSTTVSPIWSTRCHILTLKCNSKFDFDRGSAQTRPGELTAFYKIPWLDIRGSTPRGREGENKRNKGKGMEEMFNFCALS